MTLNADGYDSFVKLGVSVTGLTSDGTGAHDGQLAYDQAQEKLFIWKNGVWVPLGTGLGSSIRPNSLFNPRQSPSAYDDEFESTTLDAKWTRTATGTTVVTGTVFPFNTVTPDCIQDLHSTWPSWILFQSDESSASTVKYMQPWTATTDASIMVTMMFASASPASGANENAIRILLENSGDADEWVRLEAGFSGGGREIILEVSNAGAVTTTTSPITFPNYSGLQSECMVLYKDSDDYMALCMGDYGGYIGPDVNPVTKAGVTTFDRIGFEFTTDNRVESVILGIDAFRVYGSLTWALKNP